METKGFNTDSRRCQTLARYCVKFFKHTCINYSYPCIGALASDAADAVPTLAANGNRSGLVKVDGGMSVTGSVPVPRTGMVSGGVRLVIDS